MQTTRVDVIALARGGNYVNVGYFSSAYKLMETSLFFSDALIRAAMPAMLYARQPTDIGRILRALYSTAAVFYFPLVVAMVIRGGDLLGLLFGQEYATGGRTTMIALAWALLALVTLSALTTALLVSNHSVDVAAVAAITMVVKFVIVWPLVDRYGALGAGIAVAIAFTTQACLLVWRLHRHAGWPRMGASLLPASAGSVAMCLPLLTGLPVIPALSAGGLAFVAVWWVVARRADPDAIARVRSLIGR
ncbi:MAG: polysaccharide biosynthesis C-terminal domain-containing protein [Candidatus Nanopelagicales bacterium]